MPVWIWFVAAGVLGVAELLTGTFYMLILAVAACFGAAASLLGLRGHDPGRRGRCRRIAWLRVPLAPS